MTKMLSMIFIAAITTGAWAQEPKQAPWETTAACRARLKDPVKCFATHARAGMALCSMTWQLALTKGTTDEAGACTATAESAMRPYYDDARRALARNKTATEALKDAYANWLTAIRGLSPSLQGETLGQYQFRTTQLDQGVEQKLTRLEIQR